MLQHVYVDGATAKGECRLVLYRPAANHALTHYAHLLLAQDTEHAPTGLSNASMNFNHAGKRDYQQDRHIAIPDFKPNHGGHDQVSCCLVGVFDGHKSEQAAELAASKMPGIIAARKLSHAACHCLLLFHISSCRWTTLLCCHAIEYCTLGPECMHSQISVMLGSCPAWVPISYHRIYEIVKFCFILTCLPEWLAVILSVYGDITMLPGELSCQNNSDLLIL